MLGGHAQSGGWGMLGRSFGLFADTVKALEIITHDGTELEVTKESNPDMFYALLGGSPGNFGVLTHITFTPFHDEQYKGSRGMKAIYNYSHANLKRVLDILVEMAEDDAFSRNFDLGINCLDLGASLGGHSLPDIPELKVPELDIYKPMIVIYAQWVPTSPNDTFGTKEQAWFDRILKGHFGIPIFGLNEVVKAPMSKIVQMWLFKKHREFNTPYVKRTYLTSSTTLSKTGWSDWVASRFDAIVGFNSNSLHFVSQIQVFGGAKSQFRVNANNGTSHSWRDTTVCATIDCFHEDNEIAREAAESWQHKNDVEGIGANGKFSKVDKRVLWGSYGDWNMENVWQCYYDDKEKYEKLGRLRGKMDPDGVFTPNPFSVKRIL
ncbi:hypothetical protein EJ05DRAFT_471902 [Pseudovirgaria hyperparasitica]|uniref:FAD-binding domain-containing protein n=1 Tax=Pseudovirgaria hyperparasitica TaxID=470096 RepID=A0A6A6WLB2_9PEZI|nr:uncharacterized protein EJ05DRAFT_471902 [Pseudovirgaria hyperparasitica]KAF2762936.1 hypothetical protein EJ05DRAFT_471902 [Pseudovirgaria hyperparasitica]